MDADMAAAKIQRANAKEGAIAAASAKGEGKGAPEKEPEPDDGSISVSIPIPQGKIGRIIGPKGANITFIKEKTGVKAIDTQGDVAVVIGQPEDVPKAEMAIRELIEKGYMSISYENFKADQIYVSSTSIPNIIGKGGAIIQVIKKECEVEIDVEATPKQAEGAKRVVTKVKVSIVGELPNVEKAKECIKSIDEFSYHELTHPGFTHEELAIEEWKYRFIIGPGGSQMRHIQNSWHVQVTIPRDGGEDAKVVVVGEAISVEKAVKFINKTCEEAELPQGRDKPEKTQDKWDKDDEGPQEAWMSAYMYKRK
jgi:polyribonucleotide nucleotidyltransferase